MGRDGLTYENFFPFQDLKPGFQQDTFLKLIYTKKVFIESVNVKETVMAFHIFTFDLHKSFSFIMSMQHSEQIFPCSRHIIFSFSK